MPFQPSQSAPEPSTPLKVGDRRRLLLVLLFLGASDSSHFELPSTLQALLDSGRWDSTPLGFRVIALSHLADGCVNQWRAKPELKTDAQACVAAALRRAKQLNFRQDDGLFLSHLNLIYGDFDAMGVCADEAAHQTLSRELARRSLADSLKHAASYSSSSLRWPADQSVTLASLARYDAAHHASLLTQPLADWKAVMKAHLDLSTGLPHSEVTGKGVGALHPRGCAQSYITRYLAESDPALATLWWAGYKKHFFVRLGPVVGFREWLKGAEHQADADSGPIVFGIGTAASALALSAAKAQGDTVLAAQLEASQQTVMASGVGGSVAKSVLAQAIAFEGRWQRKVTGPGEKGW